MNEWSLTWLAAAALSVLICATHIFLGGREAARPLLEHDALKSISRMTNYYTWHLTTLALGLMATGFALSARPGATADAAAIALAFAVGAIGLCLAINARWRLRHKEHPQWILFLPVAILGGLGFVA